MERAQIHLNFKQVRILSAYNKTYLTIEKLGDVDWLDENNEDFIYYCGGHPNCGGISYQEKNDRFAKVIVWGCD